MQKKTLMESYSRNKTVHCCQAGFIAGKKPYSFIFIIIYLFIFIIVAMPGSVGALEVFLNDNRSETGTIGFVDIDFVFRTYPGIAFSKEMLENEIKRKEEELARRNTKIYKQKAKAAKLRQEKELAIVIPEMLEERHRIEEAQKQLKQEQEKLQEESENTKKEAEKLQKQQRENEKQRFIIEYRQMGLHEEDIQRIAKEKFPEDEMEKTAENEPEAITEAKIQENSGTKTGDPATNGETTAENKENQAKIEQNGENTSDSKPREAEYSGKTEKNAYDAVPIPVLPRSQYRSSEEEPQAPLYTVNIPGIGDFAFSVSTEPAKIQEELQKLENQIQNDEDAAKRYEEQAEKELAEYEDAHTRHLLGKIYSALKKLTHKEEISVVIDKRNILYGKKTVDLTQKLLDLLEKPEEEE